LKPKFSIYDYPVIIVLLIFILIGRTGHTSIGAGALLTAWLWSHATRQFSKPAFSQSLENAKG